MLQTWKILKILRRSNGNFSIRNLHTIFIARQHYNGGSMEISRDFATVSEQNPIKIDRNRLFPVRSAHPKNFMKIYRFFEIDKIRLKIHFLKILNRKFPFVLDVAINESRAGVTAPSRALGVAPARTKTGGTVINSRAGDTFFSGSSGIFWQKVHTRQIPV